MEHYNAWLYVGIVGAFISLGVALYLYFWVLKQDPGTERAQEVAQWIRDGSLLTSNVCMLRWRF